VLYKTLRLQRQTIREQMASIDQRFLLVTLLVYGTWELAGNRSMLLHNGISFVAGITVAAGVLMLLVALEWVIREACLGKQYMTETTTKTGSASSNHKKGKNEAIFMVYHYISDRLTLGIKNSKQHKYLNISLDQLVLSLTICKLLLAWNSDSDWSVSPVKYNGIRLFFVLLYLLHLNSVFKGVGVSLCNVVYNPKQFTEMLSVIASLVVASVLSSDAAYLLLNDESSAFALHSKAFGSAVLNAIIVGVVCSLAMLIALAMALCISSGLSTNAAYNTARKGPSVAMRFVLFVSLTYIFTATSLIPSVSFTYYSIQYFVVVAHISEILLLY